MEYIVKILTTEFLTHNVKIFVIEKPKNYKFIPGQANKISINNSKWKYEQRPFTFTNLNEDSVLEFTIKSYPQHKGVTEQLHKLKPGDELIIREPFGTINYKGIGVFIAGGAGITPFIAIFRQLQKNNKLTENKLIFSNKKAEDVILEKELREIFKENLILTLTEENKQGYENKKIDEEFLKEHINNFNQNFYICGTPEFVKDIRKILNRLGVKKELLIFEKL